MDIITIFNPVCPHGTVFHYIPIFQFLLLVALTMSMCLAIRTNATVLSWRHNYSEATLSEVLSGTPDYPCKHCTTLRHGRTRTRPIRTQQCCVWENAGRCTVALSFPLSCKTQNVLIKSSYSTFHTIKLVVNIDLV